MTRYSFRVTAISRASIRGALATASHRAGDRLVDRRTGEVHDYRSLQDVTSHDLVLPLDVPAWAHDRAALWNAVEQATTRENAVQARELEVLLPATLSVRQRRGLALALAQALVTEHGCAVDVSLHSPHPEGLHRHHHVHLLVTSRRLGVAGFTEAARELAVGTSMLMLWRERFSEIQDGWLQAAGVALHAD